MYYHQLIVVSAYMLKVTVYVLCVYYTDDQLLLIFWLTWTISKGILSALFLRTTHLCSSIEHSIVRTVTSLVIGLDCQYIWLVSRVSIGRRCCGRIVILMAGFGPEDQRRVSHGPIGLSP